MDYQYILVDVKDRIATVTINRPEYSNAFARESYFEIADAMNTLGAREDVGAIVITGAGKHFSAGGDIKRFKMLVDTGAYLKAEDIEAVSAMPMSIRNCPKPVIAMINGVATGAGLSCALACDFRIVEPSSKMIMAFVNMGLCGDNESIYTLMRLVGPVSYTHLKVLDLRQVLFQLPFASLPDMPWFRSHLDFLLMHEVSFLQIL